MLCSVDTLFRSVGALFYRPKELHPTGATVYVDGDYDNTQYSTLDLLKCPIRKRSVYDSWNAREIALFEQGICQLDKDFYAISRHIQSKTTVECVQFYYKSVVQHTPSPCPPTCCAHLLRLMRSCIFLTVARCIFVNDAVCIVAATGNKVATIKSGNEYGLG